MSKTTTQAFSASPSTTELTAYMGGACVVRESRTVDLAQGAVSLILGGLPAQLLPGTHTIVSIEGVGKAKLRNITHRQANLNLQSVLRASIGKQITVAEGIYDDADTMHGELVCVLDGNRLVLKAGGDGAQCTVVPFTTNVGLPEGILEGLSSTPSVAMNLEVTEAGAYQLKSLYESEGVSWNPWYEIFFDSKTGKLSRFACYVALSNHSGTDFKDAGFKLIGSYNQSQSKGRARSFSAAPQMASLEMAGGGLESADAPASESVGEHKLYVLPDAISIANGETVNSILVLAGDVPVKQEYHLHGGYYVDARGLSEAELPKIPVNVTLKLQNTADNKLGMALPPGEFRVLEADSAGQLQKTDTVHLRERVSPNESFKLDMTTPARDLKGVRVLLAFEEDPHHTQELRKKATEDKTELPHRFREEDREVTLFNYGDKPMSVCVHESFHDGTEIKWASYPEQGVWNMDDTGARCIMTVPATAGDKPGRASFRYVARWQVE
jgi:hypothetical protein